LKQINRFSPQNYSVEKVVRGESGVYSCLLAATEEKGRSGKLSDQSEILLHCSVAISNSESFIIWYSS